MKYIITTMFVMVATFLIYNLTQFYELAKQSQVFVTVSSLLLAVVLGTLALLSNSFKVQKSQVIPFALVYLGFVIFFMYSANDKGLLLLTIINLMLSSFSYGNMLNNKLERHIHYGQCYKVDNRYCLSFSRIAYRFISTDKYGSVVPDAYRLLCLYQFDYTTLYKQKESINHKDKICYMYKRQER